MAVLKSTKIVGDLEVTGFIKGKMWPANTTVSLSKSLPMNITDSRVNDLVMEIEITDKFDLINFRSVLRDVYLVDLDIIDLYRRVIIKKYYDYKKDPNTDISFTRPPIIDEYI